MCRPESAHATALSPPSQTAVEPVVPQHPVVPHLRIRGATHELTALETLVTAAERGGAALDPGLCARLVSLAERVAALQHDGTENAFSQQRATFPLLLLPDVLVARVLAGLPARDLARVAQASQRMCAQHVPEALALSDAHRLRERCVPISAWCPMQWGCPGCTNSANGPPSTPLALHHLEVAARRERAGFGALALDTRMLVSGHATNTGFPPLSAYTFVLDVTSGNSPLYSKLEERRTVTRHVCRGAASLRLSDEAARLIYQSPHLAARVFAHRTATGEMRPVWGGTAAGVGRHGGPNASAPERRIDELSFDEMDVTAMVAPHSVQLDWPTNPRGELVPPLKAPEWTHTTLRLATSGNVARFAFARGPNTRDDLGTAIGAATDTVVEQVAEREGALLLARLLHGLFGEGQCNGNGDPLAV